jgi:acetyl-CoA C-acetyltransferase
MEMDDIGTVVVSGTDQADGRVINCMVASGPAGGVGRDMTGIASAGEHALAYAYLQIQAGLSDVALAVTWSKPSECVAPEHSELVQAEPFFLRPIGMNATVSAALQAGSYVNKHGEQLAERAELVSRRHRQASEACGETRSTLTVDEAEASPYVAWPLRHAELPTPCDQACAMVLMAGDRVTDGTPAAWIRGLGWVTAEYDLGSRDLSKFGALEQAAAAAYAQAGVKDIRSEVDLVELQEISAVASFASLEALGLADPGRGANSLQWAIPAVNPSGGTFIASPPHAAGFMAMLHAAQQVRGRAGNAQLTPTPAAAIGAAVHGFAGQGSMVMILASTAKGGV